MKNGKTALITGASRGLGLALAKRLAEEGWNLIIDARGADKLEEACSMLSDLTEVTAIAGDVGEPEHRKALSKAARLYHGLDAVINNASILGPSPQPNLLDYPIEAFEKVLQANLIAPLAVLQAVAEQINSDGVVINITSDAAVEAYEGWGGYGASKAGLEHLSAILAEENPNLRIYWVDPGDMQTEMHQQAFPGEDISDRPLPEESVPGLIELLRGELPSGRYLAKQVIKNLAAN